MFKSKCFRESSNKKHVINAGGIQFQNEFSQTKHSIFADSIFIIVFAKHFTSDRFQIWSDFYQRNILFLRIQDLIPFLQIPFLIRFLQNILLPVDSGFDLVSIGETFYFYKTFIHQFHNSLILYKISDDTLLSNFYFVFSWLFDLFSEYFI